MKNTLTLVLMIVALGTMSCQKEDIANRDKLIIGTWDCVDYADSVNHEWKGRPPVFISNLYEKGYAIKKGGLMWTRNLRDKNKMYTDKRVECAWLLHENNAQLSLVFPDAMTETYAIVELTRKTLVLRGFEGFFAETATTYRFEKQ